jgi:hypothetical protein
LFSVFTVCFKCFIKVAYYHFRDWWNKVSVQKPLKCNKLDFFNENVDAALWSLFDQFPIVSSRECGPNQTSVPFEIRGNGIRIENGFIEGSGKLIILQNWPEEVAEEDKV